MRAEGYACCEVPRLSPHTGKTIPLAEQAPKNQEVLSMRVFRSARWLLLTLFLSLLSVSSHSQIVISVGFAPPELPVYVQPVCPEPNLM